MRGIALLVGVAAANDSSVALTGAALDASLSAVENELYQTKLFDLLSGQLQVELDKLAHIVGSAVGDQRDLAILLDQPLERRVGHPHAVRVIASP
jgi:hypothetical protein